MDELPPQPSRLIRKSAHGRTQLFLPSTSALLREVKCMGGIQRYDTANVYHVLPDVYKEGASCCWHCCEALRECEPSIPIPRLYDSSERLFHVYGATCSLGCAKAYILEHTTFDRGQHLNVLVKMARDVYGHHDVIVETPPRPALRRFGGAFDPTTRRQRATCRIVEPPFVSYCMLVEEVATSAGAITELPRAPVSMQVEEAATFEEPPPPSLFAEYLARRRTGAPPANHPPAASSSSEASSSKRPRTGAGPLSRFAKTKTPSE